MKGWGLDRGEKPLYIVSERAIQEIEKALGEAGVDTQDCLASR